MTKFRRRTFEVDAARWMGQNIDEVRELVEKYCGPECGFRNEPDDRYNTVQWSCCDDHELDLGDWVVFLIEPEDEEFGGSLHTITSDRWFHRGFEEVK